MAFSQITWTTLHTLDVGKGLLHKLGKVTQQKDIPEGQKRLKAKCYNPIDGSHAHHQITLTTQRPLADTFQSCRGVNIYS